MSKLSHSSILSINKKEQLDFDILIHVGFPKCASTTLQENFFVQCEDVEYIGQCSPSVNMAAFENSIFLSSLLSLEECVFEEKYEEVLATLKSVLSGTKPAVVSSELAMISHYQSGMGTVAATDRWVIANRYKRLFPNAKILMVIRNQLSFLRSYYAAAKRSSIPLTMSFNQWLSFQQDRFDNGLQSVFHIPDYQLIYEMYEKIFGMNNIKVMLLENFIKNSSEALADICRFIGINDSVAANFNLDDRRNTRNSYAQALLGKAAIGFRPLKRVLPKSWNSRLLHYHLMNAAGAVFPFQPEYSESWKKDLRTLYKKGNRKLNNKLGLNMEMVDYPL